MCQIVANVKFVHWRVVTFWYREKGMGWVGAHRPEVPLGCTKRYKPPIKGQCTNHRITL